MSELSWIAEALGLIKAYPLGILVLALAGAVVYQTRKINQVAREKNILIRQMFKIKAQGNELDEEAEQTLIDFEPRKSKRRK